jgi:ParB-like chromosome segregation protein Spo0J
MGRRLTETIPVEFIEVGERYRQVSDEAVASLAASINGIGLKTPITVRYVEKMVIRGEEIENVPVLVTGNTRLRAAKQLGWAEIECFVEDCTETQARLWEIDENLCRAELSPSERAKHTAERKAIYEEIHPETRHGGDRSEASRQLGDLPDRFTADTASVSGRSERAVQRDAERGEKVIDEVLSMIAGTKLDTGTYLDKLKKLTPNDQVTAAKRDLALLREQQRQATAGEKAKADRNSIDRDVQARAAREVANIIAEHVPAEWWDALKANLYAAKNAAFIANELTNISGESIMDRRYGT